MIKKKKIVKMSFKIKTNTRYFLIMLLIIRKFKNIIKNYLIHKKKYFIFIIKN